jgi:hypothetical protein
MNTWLEPPPRQYRRGMGCFGKGCLIVSCFILFLLIAGAVGVFIGMKHYSALGHGLLWGRKIHLLAAEPSPVPQFETAGESIEAAKRKWKDFENASHGGQPAHVELTTDDLNNLIAANRHVRGKVFVSAEGNRMHVQTSVPLDEFFGQSHYFLNGDIVLETDGPQSLDHPKLNVVTVNNQPLPADILDWKYEGRPLREYLARFKAANNIEAIEIRDGKLIIDRLGGD